MATYPNLGGMLTQAGQQQGQVLGSAFTGLAQNLMKPVDSMLARKKNEGLQKEVQDFLAANKNNPAALNAEAARYTTMGNDAVAKVFSDAAKVAAAQVAAAQEGRTSRGLQGGLAAIQAAATRGVPLADLGEAQKSVIGLGGTREQIASAYKAGVPEAKETTALDITESTILIDGVPTRVQTATNPLTGKIVSQNTIGEAEVSGKKGESKKGLRGLFADAGLEVDLDTVEGLRAARNVALTDLGNASLAGKIDDILVRKLPMNAADSVEMVRKSDPAFAINEELVEKAGRFKVLSELGTDDVAGVAALIERTVTSTTENDLRAVAELDRFRGSKDIKQAIVDWGTMLASGKLSEDTLLEYTKIMTGLEKLAKNRISDSIDNLAVAAVTEKEQEAIETARKYFGLSDDVELLN
jgi:hypothetical protein